MEMVGFVGLGRMGRPMSSNLCRKGFRLIVHDLNRDAVAELERLQARGAGSVSEVARESAIVVTMLPDSATVRQVVTGEGGIVQNAKPGTLILDMSTIAPAVTDELARIAKERGLAFVDAPVGRLASHADRGESLFMVGATDDDFARVLPLLEAMGNTIHHCGPVGSGMRTKLVNNYLALPIASSMPKPSLCRNASASSSNAHLTSSTAQQRPTGSSRSRGQPRY